MISEIVKDIKNKKFQKIDVLFHGYTKKYRRKGFKYLLYYFIFTIITLIMLPKLHTNPTVNFWIVYVLVLITCALLTYYFAFTQQLALKKLNYTNIVAFKINKLKRILISKNCLTTQKIDVISKNIKSKTMVTPIWFYSVLAAVFLPVWNQLVGVLIKENNLSDIFTVSLATLFLVIFIRHILDIFIPLTIHNEFNSGKKLLPLLEELKIEIELAQN
ncbi:hypothetical protein [Listeria newyorkensis]|uniref:hypothetical protein n=1 Tax=Listeria newyorkensis TaxID=1497681 RepID=UPI00051D65D8|nr:hypothetical protein [Listeria newyorkensis]KGL43577.1 hypothetical protein EP58_07505 [Listeria newyorkensis]